MHLSTRTANGSSASRRGCTPACDFRASPSLTPNLSRSSGPCRKVDSSTEPRRTGASPCFLGLGAGALAGGRVDFHSAFQSVSALRNETTAFAKSASS
eukprot:3908605-Rhodomonas_salina.1